MNTKKKLWVRELGLIFYFIFFPMLSANEECKTVLSFLTSPDISIQELLGGDSPFRVIQKTNTRDILTTPTGLFYHKNDFFSPQIGINFFFTRIPAGIAFPSKELSTLFNMSTIDKIFTLSSKLVNGKQYSAIDFPFIINTFDYVHVNDLRVGSIIQGSYEIDKNILFYGQIPLTYNAYYMSLPTETQSSISTEIAQLKIDNKVEKPNKTDNSIIIDHTVADFFGIERTILGIMYKGQKERFNIEGRIFLPGGIAKRGLIGGNFKDLPDIKTNFDLKTFIFNIIDEKKQKYESNIDKLFTNTIDKIVSTVYGNAFVQNGYGLSPSIHLRFPLEKALSLNVYGTYIYNFPTKKTIYGYKNTLNKFPKISDNTTEEEACTILSLFDKELINKISLYPINLYVSQGNETQANISIQSSNTKETVCLGLDIWHKFAHKISRSKDVIIPEKQFDATQINLFLDLELFRQVKENDLTIQFLFQSTLYAVGIGKEIGGKIQIGYLY